MSMFSGESSTQEVTCIACGDTLPRSAAREYDKYGNRWERSGKEFEFLCKPCDKTSSHMPRNGLEALLIRADAGETDTESFLDRYLDLVSDTGPQSG
jgi:hypothetical protein